MSPRVPEPDHVDGVRPGHAGPPATSRGSVGPGTPGGSIGSPTPAGPVETGAAADPVESGASHGMVRNTAYPWWLEQFSRRRLVVALVAWPVLFAVFSAAAGASAAGSPLWTVLLAVTSGLAALTLSTYVPTPGMGRRVEVGCEPCARIAGASVLGSLLLLTMANPNPTAAVAPLLLAAAGLAQRVRGSRSCPTGR